MSATLLHSIPTTPLVLHVTEAMGGGVEGAVHDLIRSAPHFRHALLYARRGASDTDESHPDGLVEVVDVGRGFRALSAAYGPVVRRLRPDVIHLHSAWAGLIGRTRVTGPGEAAIVYSPHSYYFDRQGLRPPIRAAAWLAERALTARTALTAAVSPFEAEAARRLGGRAEYVPNVARLPEQLHWSPSGGTKTVVLAGRITAQKDPGFLLEVLQLVRPSRPRLAVTWVGSGDPVVEDRLRRAGVHVTGWLSRVESLDRMSRADVFLHTAAWEGSPITLLEARTIGLPIIARSIPALESLGFEPLLRSPRQVADALLDVLDGRDAPAAPPITEPSRQSRALEAAYSSILPTVRRLPARVRLALV